MPHQYRCHREVKIPIWAQSDDRPQGRQDMHGNAQKSGAPTSNERPPTLPSTAALSLGPLKIPITIVLRGQCPPCCNASDLTFCTIKDQLPLGTLYRRMAVSPLGTIPRESPRDMGSSCPQCPIGRCHLQVTDNRLHDWCVEEGHPNVTKKSSWR